MNKVQLIGRLTSDPMIKYTEKNVAFARFNLAVNDGFGDNKKAYFINMIAWGSRAETIQKYLTKGSKVGIVGKLQTGSFEKDDGTRGYTYDVYVESLEFLDNKNNSEDDIIVDESDDELSIDDDGLPF